MYKVTKEDLKGQIEEFPLEIVQRMVEHQVNRGNKLDVTVFQECRATGGSTGFDWDKTVEGHDFWSEVITDENFSIFFEKYPEKHTPTLKVEAENFHFYKDCFYKVIHIGKTKDPNSREWFTSVTYKQTTSGSIFTRELQDFENKFKLVTFEK